MSKMKISRRQFAYDMSMVALALGCKQTASGLRIYNNSLQNDDSWQQGGPAVTKLKEMIRAIGGDPDKLVIKSAGSDDEVLKQYFQLCKMPWAYIEQLVKYQQSNGFNIEIVSSIPGYSWASGLCTYGGGGARKIHIRQSVPAYTVMHEVGHAINDFTDRGRKESGGDDPDVVQTISQGYSTAQSKYTGTIRSYALQNIREFFADGVSCFYFNKKTEEWMKNTIPEINKMFESVMLPRVADPLNDPCGRGSSGTTGGGTTPVLGTNMGMSMADLEELKNQYIAKRQARQIPEIVRPQFEDEFDIHGKFYVELGPTMTDFPPDANFQIKLYTKGGPTFTMAIDGNKWFPIRFSGNDNGQVRTLHTQNIFTRASLSPADIATIMKGGVWGPGALPRIEVKVVVLTATGQFVAESAGVYASRGHADGDDSIMQKG